jgi:hypothetical protein
MLTVRFSSIYVHFSTEEDAVASTALPLGWASFFGLSGASNKLLRGRAGLGLGSHSADRSTFTNNSFECKAGKTVRPAMAAPLLSLGNSLGKRAKRLILVHQKSRSTPATTAVASGVEALDLERFVNYSLPVSSHSSDLPNS